MLPKNLRLKTKDDFGRFFKSSKSVKSQHFSININRSYTKKFAVITSKKVGKAHDRNRIRRVIFNSISEFLTKLPNEGYVVYVFPNSAELSNAQIRLEINGLFSEFVGMLPFVTQKVTPKCTEG